MRCSSIHSAIFENKWDWSPRSSSISLWVESRMSNLRLISFNASLKNFICILQDCSDLHPEMIIKYVSIYDQNNQISVFSAKILEIKIDDLDERQQKLIKIEPMEYYEKN